MENFENKAPLQPVVNDVQAQFEALRHLVTSILILVVVISGTLNIYLLRQWRSTTKDLTAIRPQATQMIAEYQKVSGPLMNDFVKKISEYGRTHPDFTPVLAKYGIKPVAATSAAPAAPSSPLPATAPKK
jgi:hypothetical protein